MSVESIVNGMTGLWVPFKRVLVFGVGWSGVGVGGWSSAVAGCVREGFVVQEVASVLGVAEGPQQPLLAAVLEHRAPLRVLLLLDNCEHVLGETAAFADRVLAA